MVNVPSGADGSSGAVSGPVTGVTADVISGVPARGVIVELPLLLLLLPLLLDDDRLRSPPGGRDVLSSPVVAGSWSALSPGLTAAGGARLGSGGDAVVAFCLEVSPSSSDDEEKDAKDADEDEDEDRRLSPAPVTVVTVGDGVPGVGSKGAAIASLFSTWLPRPPR
jgi:hypothetical protein